MVLIHSSTLTQWEELQESLGTQFFMMGNTRECLSHVWRSFHYDEDAEITDDYVQ